MICVVQIKIENSKDVKLKKNERHCENRIAICIELESKRREPRKIETMINKREKQKKVKSNNKRNNRFY